MNEHSAQRIYTADLVVLHREQILLIKRRKYPYQDTWALPGGKKNARERLEQTAMRELYEETGLTITRADLEPIAIFDRPGRDPRPGDYISQAYLVSLDEMPVTQAGSDATSVQWFSLRALPVLAFDHHEIVRQAFLKRGLSIRSVLNGEHLHAAYRMVQDFVRSWDEIGDMAQLGYNNMAHLLCEQLLLCESCGQQQQKHEQLYEVAGFVFCGDCIAPPPEVRAVEYLAMAQSTEEWLDQAQGDLSPQERQQWQRERDKLIRRAQGELRKAMDEQGQSQEPKGAA